MSAAEMEIRPTDESDLPTIHGWYLEPHIVDVAVSTVPVEFSVFRAEYSSMMASQTSRCFVIWDAQERIGLVELRSIGELAGRLQGEAVLWLACRRRTGLSVRLIVWLLRYAFDTVGLDQLWWSVGVGNTEMLRLCRELGFREVAGEECSANDRTFFEVREEELELLSHSRILRHGLARLTIEAR